MKKLPEKVSKKSLLELPLREDWNDVFYNSLLVFPTGKKHESGWAEMCIVGVKKDMGEIVCYYADDLGWSFSPEIGFLMDGVRRLAMRTDCHYPAGIMRFWGNGIQFKIGMPGSSTDIYVLPNNET